MAKPKRKVYYTEGGKATIEDNGRSIDPGPFTKASTNRKILSIDDPIWEERARKALLRMKKK